MNFQISKQVSNLEQIKWLVRHDPNYDYKKAYLKASFIRDELVVQFLNQWEHIIQRYKLIVMIRQLQKKSTGYSTIDRMTRLPEHLIRMIIMKI